MIDYIILVADNLSDDYSTLLQAKMKGRDCGFNCKVNDEGEPLYYDTNSKGLYFKLYRIKTGWKLKIKGSIKNFHKKENYTFMDFGQTTKVIMALARFIGLSADKIRVTSLEVSVPVATAPIDKLVKSYGKREFMPMLVPAWKTGFADKRYGVRAISSHAYTSVKIYQKDREQAIHYGRKIEQQQQVEFSIDKARFLRDKMNKAGIATECSLKTGVLLIDLTNSAVQHILCGLLLDIPYQLTLKTDAMPNIDTNALLLEPGMTKKKLLNLLAFADSRRYRELLKVESRTRYFEQQKEFTRLRDQLCPASDQQLQKFQQALQAAVEAGKPKAPVSSSVYTGKQSRKSAKTPASSTESVIVAD